MNRLHQSGQSLVLLGLLAAWASLGQLLSVRGLPYAPAAFQVLGPLVSTPGAILASLLYFVGLYGLLAGRPAAPPLLVTLLALGAVFQGWQWPPGVGVNGATTLPGAALAASAIANYRRPASGLEAACGIVAVSYPLAAVSKLLSSGFVWTSAGNIGLHIASQSYAGARFLQPFRLAVAGTPLLCSALGLGTMIIELGTILFLFPRCRLPVAGAVTALQLGIALLMGLHHYDWMATTLGYALLSEARAQRCSTTGVTDRLTA